MPPNICKLRASSRCLGQSRPRHFLISLVCVVTVAGLPFLARTFARNPKIDQAQPALAHLDGRISIQAAGRGNPTINLSDGHELITSYVGSEELRLALEQNLAEPRGLASADFMCSSPALHLASWSSRQ